MFSFVDICLLCLNNSKNLKLIKPTDNIDYKFKYFLPENDVISDIPKYICTKCEDKLNNFYEFKQKCLQNIATFEKYAQQITKKDDSSVILAANSQHGKVEKTAKHNCSTEYETETDVGMFNFEEITIKEEIHENNLLPHDLIRDSSKSDDTCKRNEKINEVNVQLSNEKNEQEQYKCQKCDVTFNNYSDLQEHQSKCDKKLYKCKICNKTFRRSQTLKSHKFIHTDEKPFTCEICKKTFRQIQTLKDHKLTHTGEKPFNCDVCKKSFRQSSHLKRHRLTHTDEKPFTCEFCNKSFRLCQTLKDHKLIHTGGKPFTCHICNKSFRQLSNLKTHCLTHNDEKPFTCEVCNKSFKLLESWKKHEFLHAGKST